MMANKTFVVIIYIVVIKQICPIYCKTLSTNSKDDDVDRKSATTSYYRHNVFGPNTYAFGFKIHDKASANIQFRDERRYENGTLQGLYGYVQPDGSLMVTHFLADNKLGYLSQTENFAPGDKPKWQENWLTRKPNKLKEKPLDSESITDDMEKLNITSILLPVEPIKKEHGIDLNPPELEKALVNPAVLEVINGEAPLISDPKKKDKSKGFETINKFIPAEFPIVPFELPSENLKINLNEGTGEKPILILNKTYDKHTTNLEKPLTLPVNSSSSNDKHANKTQKLLPTTAIKMTALNESNSIISPTAKSISIDKNTDWYDQVINQTRQEYLATVH